MLAAAAGPVPVPTDVAARLDGVLAELQNERAGAEVVELRARRRWPRLLLAAAAVVVGGYAVGAVATQGTLSGSGGGETAADSSVPQKDSLLADEGSGGGQAGGPEAGDVDSAPELLDERSALMHSAIRLRSDRLEAGVLRALRVLDARLLAGRSRVQAADPACPAPELAGRERALDVRYDGQHAVLVAGPVRSGTVEVTIYTCSGDELDTTLVRP
jgi:hypothetical protein